MPIMKSKEPVEEAWWTGVFAERRVPDPGHLPADPMELYDYRLACWARFPACGGDPAKCAGAALALSQAAIKARVPYMAQGEFSAAIWRAWARDYGAEEPAPWERE